MHQSLLRLSNIDVEGMYVVMKYMMCVQYLLTLFQPADADPRKNFLAKISKDCRLPLSSLIAEYLFYSARTRFQLHERDSTQLKI